MNDRLKVGLARQEALLLKLQAQIAGPSPADQHRQKGQDLTHGDQVGDLAKQIELILSRLNSLETRNAQTRLPGDWSVPVESKEEREMAARQIAAFEKEVGAARAVNPVVDRFANEAGQSEWGEATANRINWSYADASFFAKHGGQLLLDCRQTSCRAEWSPASPVFDEAEAEQSGNFAEYELMAVVAQDGSDVGEIHTVSHLDEIPPRVEVYFARRSGD